MNPRRPSPREPQSKILEILSDFIKIMNTEDFHNFLKLRNTGEETNQKYLKIFKQLKYNKLKSRSKHTIITLRLVIQYLYYFHNIDLRHYLTLLKVPKSGIDLFVPSEDQIKDTLERAKRREDILMVYTILLASGIRLSEAVLFLGTFKRDKLIEVDDSIVKYPISALRKTKRIFYIYMPSSIARSLREVNMTRDVVSRYAIRWNLIRPKYVRKFVAQKMFELGIDPLVIDFIQGRVARSVLARHYLNLSYLADRQYKKYAEWLSEIVDNQ